MHASALRHHAAALAATVVAALAWSGCAGTLTDPAAFTDSPAEAGAGEDAAAGPEASDDSAVGGCQDVPSLFAASCAGTGCHDSVSKAQALDLVSPGVASRLVGVHATEGAGLLIDPSNPSASVVYTKLLASPPFGARMPTGSTLDDATIGCVYDWVAAQANLAAPGGTDGGTGTPVDAGHAEGGPDGGSVAPFSVIRVAAGQTANVTDAQGQTWTADTGYTGGTADVETTQVSIAGTDAPVLYNGQRYGNPSFSYAFTVPNGTYTVTLKYAELFVTGPGMRLFDVAVNGTTVATAFDIYATAGAMNTAIDESYPVTVTNGTIQVAFTQGSVQFPKVDAIAVTQGSPGDAGP
ncbi:MAG TPA: malectin [Polyangiaceae bacterium]|jgi:hypothetical protein